MSKRILLALAILICLVTVNVSCDIVSPEPSVEQIKSDLIGETLTQGTLTWHFHALSEFKEVTIVDKIREGNTIEYDCPRIQISILRTRRRDSCRLL